jgi:phosphatidylserine decarboxylase
MKHSERSKSAARKLIFIGFLLVLLVAGVGLLAALLSSFVKAIAGALIGLWLLFTGFTLYFFRDPEARVPSDPKVIVSPAHGTVDVIDETSELEFMGGPCRRISIFLSVIDVHVQQAPVAGRIVHLKHSPGQFVSALKAESCAHNENVLIGIASTERPGEKIGVRLLAGLIARRIVPFVVIGDEPARGERISLIQFGSRAHLYLPLSTRITVKLGDKVVGGETVMATRD